MIRVFVYGTLKEGFPNFPINAGSRVPGNFITHAQFPLYLVGARHSPWMVNLPGQQARVTGQVFDVTPETLRAMDLLEHVGEPDGYERVEIMVLSVQTGKANPGTPGPDVEEPHAGSQTGLRVFAYLKPGASLAGAQIMAGPIAEYTLDHAARYQHRTP